MSTLFGTPLRSRMGAFVKSAMGGRKMDRTPTGIIYIGGQFTGKVAWYDPDTTSFIFPSSPFLGSDSVRSIIFFNGQLHVGATDGNVYVYDEEFDSWSTLGTFGNLPRRLLEFEGGLYTCCDTGVYLWNAGGGTWDVVGGFSGDARDIAVHNGVLWMIGSFSSPGNNLAFLSGGVWQDGDNCAITLNGTQMRTLYDDGTTLYSGRTSGASFVQDGVYQLDYGKR